MTDEQILTEIKTTFGKNESLKSRQAIDKRAQLLTQLFPNAGSHNARVRLADTHYPMWRGYEVDYLSTRTK